MNTNDAKPKPLYTEEQFMEVLNALYKMSDLLGDIVHRIDEWHTLDRQSLIELVGESDRLTADDMPADSWLAEGVREYQAVIAARYSR